MVLQRLQRSMMIVSCSRACEPTTIRGRIAYPSLGDWLRKAIGKRLHMASAAFAVWLGLIN